MSQMNVVVHPTTDGMMTFQLIVPRRQPKLSINKSHYMLADEKRVVRAEINGRERDVVALVKIWSPVSKSDRGDESVRMLKDRIRKNSPMLI